MAASIPFFGSLPFLKSFSGALPSARHWKILGAATALSLGTSFAVCRAKEARRVSDRSTETHLFSFALASLSPFASLSLAPMEESVESTTGVAFPGACLDGRQLAGIGLRKKRVLGLKSITVYAYGMYVDPDSLKSSLSDKSSVSTPEITENVTATDVGLTVRLVIVYGRLKIQSIRSAFEESVGKGLKKFSGDDNKELLGRFTSLFTDDLKLPKGTVIELSRLPGHALQTRVNGEDIGNVQSPLLCRAVFDLYIGEDAFDKPAREAMGSYFATLLSS